MPRDFNPDEMASRRRLLAGGLGLAGAAALAGVPSGIAAEPPPSGDGTLNVKAFGARGDGTTDAAPAIQKAINAGARLGGRTVYLPPGVYTLGSSLRITDTKAVHLRGAGKRLVTELLPLPSLADKPVVYFENAEHCGCAGSDHPRCCPQRGAAVRHSIPCEEPQAVYADVPVSDAAVHRISRPPFAMGRALDLPAGPGPEQRDGPRR